MLQHSTSAAWAVQSVSRDGNAIQLGSGEANAATDGGDKGSPIDLSMVDDRFDPRRRAARRHREFVGS